MKDSARVEPSHNFSPTLIFLEEVLDVNDRGTKEAPPWLEQFRRVAEEYLLPFYPFRVAASFHAMNDEIRTDTVKLALFDPVERRARNRRILEWVRFHHVRLVTMEGGELATQLVGSEELVHDFGKRLRVEINDAQIANEGRSR